MNASKNSQIGDLSPTPGPVYDFGPFRLDADNRFLLRDNQPVPLTPKAFDALLFLVERGGRLVIKDELMSALWPGTFVSESNLTQTIFMLRKALGESASEQRYILTVPGSGYRFADDVRTVESTPAGPVVVSAPARTSTGISLHQGIWAAVLVLAALSGYVMYRYAKPVPAQARPAAGRVMLAVLPFENLTGDASQDYFSDGFTEDTIIETGKLDPQHLGVIAHTSVLSYRAPLKPLPQIGRELGVQYVLQGSIRRDGSKVHITAELVHVADQRHLWGQEYDREPNNVVGVPAVISQAVLGEIEKVLEGNTSSPRPVATRTTNYRAYDLQLKARYSLAKRNPQAFQQAVDYFRQAITLDNGNARAYAGLAETYTLLGAYSVGPQSQFIPQAREAAQRAIQIDDRLSEAHTALALIAQNYDWDWQTAEREFRRAIELDSNNATAHQWYAEHLAFRGRFAEAFTEIEHARQLDPVSLIIASDHASILFYSRRYDEAIRQFRSILDVEPHFTHAHGILSVYLAQGRYQEAAADLKSWESVEQTQWTLLAAGLIDARSGKRRQAAEVLRELKDYERKQPLDPAVCATMYMAMGDKDRAFAELEKAREQHSVALTSLKVNPGWDLLRDDPRFVKLLRSVNLEP